MWNNIIISQPFQTKYSTHLILNYNQYGPIPFEVQGTDLRILPIKLIVCWVRLDILQKRRKLLHQTEEKRFYGDAKEVLISMSSIFYFLSCRTRVALKTIWCLSFKTLKAVVEWDRKKRNTQVVRKNKWHKKSKIIIMQSICRLPPLNWVSGKLLDVICLNFALNFFCDIIEI